MGYPHQPDDPQPEPTLLDHLQVLGDFIDDMEHAELIDDSTVDIGPACEAYKALEKFFKGYYEAKTERRPGENIIEATRELAKR